MAEASPATASAAPPSLKDRFLSLDFFRGLTMFLLIGESTRLYERLRDPGLAGTVLHAVGAQLEHHPWAGLRFWDLAQPFFMFIVGVALAFSVAKREVRGESRSRITRHAVVRALVLLFLGWALYCIEPGRITFRFQNVLPQLTMAFAGWTGAPAAEILTSLAAWAVLWSMCYWVYRRKILIKI